MTQSTYFNQVKNVLKVLQGYTKGIRFLLVMLLTLCVSAAWGADVTCDFTTQSAGSSQYTASWNYGVFTVFGGANNNKGWTYVKMGGKNTNLSQANPVYISSPQMTSAISKVQVSIIAGSLAKTGMSVNSWGVYVYSDANMTNQVDYVAGGTITKNAAVFEFTPSTGTNWSANNYYKVSFDLKNTTNTNGIIWLDKITFVESSGGGDPEPIIVKTLKSIAVTGMTTTFEQGDVFKFDGTCTATYSVTKDGVAQADETAEVTPTSVLAPDMNTIGTQTITVTYETVTTTYDITINENEVTPGIYDVLLNNVLWNVSAGQQTASVESMTGKANDITFYTTKGSSQMYASATQTRFYNGATFVISVPTGYVIKSIEFAEPTSDKKWEGSIEVNTGTYENNTKSWAGSAQEVQFTFNAQNRIANASITYEAIDLTLPSAPTFTPAAGTYNAVQNVTISAEAGTTIYYTLDGTEPTTESNVYASAIEISETTTVKAIAVKDEKVSPVASATYTINLPLTTMDQIFAKATAVGGTATPVKVTMNNWVVTGATDKNVYVTDGTKGFIIYKNDGGHGFVPGDVLSGIVACKVQLYNGSSELTELTKTTEGLTVTTGGTVTPVEVDDVNTLGGVNTGSVIKITGTCESGNVVAGVKLYGTLYTFDNLTVGNKYNVTGVYLQYGDVEEILPRKQEDIEEVIDIPTATIAIANITMEVGEEKDIEATITPDAAQSTVQYAITSGNEYITLSGTTITAVAAGTATITATIAEAAGEYYGTTKTFNVTVKPQNIAVLPFTFDGGRDDIKTTLGMSQDGLDSDYGSSPKLKFNTTGDYVLIHFNSEPGLLSYDIKGNSYSGGTFTVQESADGSAYTNIVGYIELGSEETKTHTLAATSRYVKFIYTEKVSGNVALGNITISKPDNRAEAGLAWNPSAVTLTQGDAFTAPTLNNPYSVAGITYESNNTNVATVTDAGIISLAEATGEATITASFAGNEDYKPITVTCIITVSAPPYRVTWLVNGKLLTDAELSDASTYVYEGESITKTPPAPNPEDFCGQVFVGWTIENPASGNFNEAPTVYNEQSAFPPATGNQTFYAVFADYEQQ